jgi:AcrR family transcriptional regulator
MGKIRARTDRELTARKKEILDAAERQLMTMDYDSVTLASLAKETSVSRPSMYHYYETRENIFIDLLIREYNKFETDLQPFLKRKMSRGAFCRKLAEVLLKRKLMLKLLALQVPVFEKAYDQEQISRFTGKISSFNSVLLNVLDRQFPEADEDARDVFTAQFSLYCSSLYGLLCLPQYVKEHDNTLDESEFVEICSQGLMLLSAAMTVK